MTHFFFQQYWWLIMSLLAGLLVMLTFVQGGQTLLYSIAKNDNERSLLVNSLGRKWEFTFTTLVTFGGAFFAAFPLFYSVSFGGAYWAWTIFLFCFVIQAIAYEYRSKPANVYGKKFYEVLLFINGSLGTFLLGVIVATMFTGSQFSINEMKSVIWHTPYRGLEALINPINLLLGAAVMFLSRVLGILYFMNNIKNDSIEVQCLRKLRVNTILFLLFFLSFLGFLLNMSGLRYIENVNLVTKSEYTYLHNLLANPIMLIILLLGIVLVLYGIFIAMIKNKKNAIWFTGTGTVATVFVLFAITGLNNTAFYPSTTDIQSSLTIRNASSSLYTLKTMSIVSLFIPAVLAYIFFAWKAINNKPLDEQELTNETHKY